MRFCNFCNNMFYVNIDENKDLVYYCKHCNNKDVVSKDAGSVCVIDDNKITDPIKYSQYINKYLKHDRTLPRVNNIVCPNAACSKAGSAEDEVIYIKYDALNLKYIYHCCHCEHFWTL
jgi:DNA-directed RNA polymerase subunit M/transcription elongation factor TFIIS